MPTSAETQPPEWEVVDVVRMATSWTVTTARAWHSPEGTGLTVAKDFIYDSGTTSTQQVALSSAQLEEALALHQHLDSVHWLKHKAPWRAAQVEQ